jgi:hypothetical protein
MHVKGLNFLPFSGDFHDERTSFFKCKGYLILVVLIWSDLEKNYVLLARHEYLSLAYPNSGGQI